MRRYGAAHNHRRFDLLLHELKTLKLHLPATDIQRGNNLVVRRGRRVCHVGFAKRLLYLTPEVLIVYMNHRTLSQGRQGLVRGLCGVGAHSYLVRVRHQAVGQQAFSVRRCGGSPFLVRGAVLVGSVTTTQLLGTVHGSALPKCR